MEKTNVLVYPKGPVIVEGNLSITHADGTKEEKEGKIALCRCGYSMNKPYCDGKHKDCPVINDL